MGFADNPARARILERVRSAVTLRAEQYRGPAGAIFAPVTEPLERFQKECAANLTEFTSTADAAGSAAAIAQVLESLPPGEVFIEDAPELRALAQAFSEGRAIRWSSQGAPSEASRATITRCEALVALTGSIVVSAACGGRGASIVAPVHIVYARANQLVADLDAAFARVYERGLAAQNSFVGLITGSSRTADIEKILVMGAHGPRRLVVVMEG